MQRLFRGSARTGLRRGEHGLLKSRGTTDNSHRFNGGLRNETELVPSGTKESFPREPRPKIVA